MRICMRGQQTGGEKSTKQFRFGTILLTNNSRNTRKTSM